MVKQISQKSKEAKRRYNQSHYSSIRYEEKKEIVEAFREKCRRENVAQADILRKAVLEFLGKEGEEK